MHPLVPTLIAVFMSVSGIAVAAVGTDDPMPDDAPRIAGRPLQLNGAGIGQRFVFKVYAIALYLPEPRHTAEAVLDGDGPSRISIRLLRDVGKLDFAKAIAESAADGRDRPDVEPGATGLLEVGAAIASLPQGLRSGDRLTIDWVPGLGTVIQLNHKPLMQPNADRNLYKALLKVWLGAKPTDAALKTQLLGSAAP
jgi:hypothetical protein